MRVLLEPLTIIINLGMRQVKCNTEFTVNTVTELLAILTADQWD